MQKRSLLPERTLAARGRRKTNFSGYPAWLEALTEGAGDVAMWLSHCAPIDRDPGPAVA